VSELHRISELANGVRVITETVHDVRSVALGMWIANGSADEAESDAGTSHLLEHMLFRGTPRLTSREVDELFDGLGAEVNAATDRETTVLYTRVLDMHLEPAFAALGEMLVAPAFEQLETEREVVLEEIAMYEDDPQDRVFDISGELLYDGHPLGRPVLGRAEVVAAMDDERLRAFHDERYTAPAVVVAAAGSLRHEQIVELAERQLGTLSADAAPAAPAPARVRGGTRRFVEKETEQFHVCLGGPGLGREDERRFALRVLEGALGGTTSSRLFQLIRERHGLAYAVFTYSNMHERCGDVGVYVGTRPDNLERALELLAGELAAVAAGKLEDREIERARENLKGRVALAQESAAARMHRLGSALLLDMPVLTLEQTIAEVDAVEADTVRALAAELYAPERLSIAGIGPDAERFQAAAAPFAAVGAA
jgi:predicted Zn-dependent peptidase